MLYLVLVDSKAPTSGAFSFPPTTQRCSLKYFTYVFSPDKHWGYEPAPGRHLRPLHDQKAINAMLEFGKDFKPDVWIEGGDDLDCGPVSHWLHGSESKSLTQSIG